jgi:hypothetical protein
MLADSILELSLWKVVQCAVRQWDGIFQISSGKFPLELTFTSQYLIGPRQSGKVEPDDLLRLESEIRSESWSFCQLL